MTFLICVSLVILKCALLIENPEARSLKGAVLYLVTCGFGLSLCALGGEIVVWSQILGIIVFGLGVIVTMVTAYFFFVEFVVVGVDMIYGHLKSK